MRKTWFVSCQLCGAFIEGIGKDKQRALNRAGWKLEAGNATCRSCIKTRETIRAERIRDA